MRTKKRMNKKRGKGTRRQGRQHRGLLKGSVFRYKKGKKVFEDYGEGIKYMTFDGKRHVFRYVGKTSEKKRF